MTKKPFLNGKPFLNRVDIKCNLTKEEIISLADIFETDLNKYTDFNGNTILYSYVGCTRKNNYFEIIKTKNDTYKIECNNKIIFNKFLKKINKSNQYILFGLCNCISISNLYGYGAEFCLINKLKNINI